MDSRALLATEQAKIDQLIGTSNWFSLDQARITAFAEVTNDHQFIHVDEVAAVRGPFGTTIAHGFLTLALTAPMALEAIPRLPGQTLVINYGFDKIRFLCPAPVGGRVRGHFTLADAQLRGPGQILHTFKTVVELEGSDKPALVATWLSLAVCEEPT